MNNLDAIVFNNELTDYAGTPTKPDEIGHCIQTDFHMLNQYHHAPAYVFTVERMKDGRLYVTSYVPSQYWSKPNPKKQENQIQPHF